MESTETPLEERLNYIDKKEKEMSRIYNKGGGDR
jgi:hypothetical protein